MPLVINSYISLTINNNRVAETIKIFLKFTYLNSKIGDEVKTMVTNQQTGGIRTRHTCELSETDPQSLHSLTICLSLEHQAAPGQGSPLPV